MENFTLGEFSSVNYISPLEAGKIIRLKKIKKRDELEILFSLSYLKRNNKYNFL